MKITSQKISSNVALNKIAILLDKNADNKPQKGKNVIVAIDVSGSMYGELPKIRQQLKNKIPSLIQEHDTISIIWFSGKGQAGILKEGVYVKNLIDLQQLNEAIDRFLKPIGLTAFLPPLELTTKLIERLSKLNKNDFSFIFLSDGYNNDSIWSDVVKELSSLESKIAASTFIEYGYYADSKALSEMAELTGGEKIFSEDFDSYEQSFDKIISKNTSKKIAFDISEIKSKLKYQMFFAINTLDESITTYSCIGEKESILIPENITELYCITRYKVDSVDSELSDEAKLAAAYLMSDRLRYNIVEDFLANLGDVLLLDKFSVAYGKQKLNDFKNTLKSYIFEPKNRYQLGKGEVKINPKTFCIMDLIDILQNGYKNRFFPYHPDFNYNRISAKRTVKVELTDEAMNQLKTAKSVKEIEQITSQLEAPEFIYPSDAANIGIGFENLVWNEERANLSVQTRLNGKVKLPKNEFGLTEVDSYIYRNYSLIKDGILNITEIPVSLDNVTKSTILEKSNGLVTFIEKPDVTLMVIDKLPIINRSMTVNVSAKKLAQLEFELINIQLGHKYLKNIKNIYDAKTNTISAQKYSPEAAAWLQSIGVTDYNGFSPKTETEKSGDVYVAPVLATKIEKTSTSPKVSDVFAKIDALMAAKKAESEGKKIDKKPKELNIMEDLMKSEIDTISPSVYAKGSFSYETRDIDPISVEHLNTIERQYNAKRRNLLYEIAKIKFGIILSRTWFTEFESMEENTLEGFKFNGLDTPLKVKFEFKEVEIKL